MFSFKYFLEAGETTLSNHLLKNYHRLGLSLPEFMLWIQLYRFDRQGDSFPDLAVIAEDMGMETDEIFQLLNQLVAKKCLAIETQVTDGGKRMDRYSLYPIFDKLAILEEQERFSKSQQKEVDNVKTMYQSFEKEFGRPLSSIEFQRISQWLEEDHYSPELISLALREAVLNQAYNLNYIDRVLLAWERKNIKTSQQVNEEQKRRKQALMNKEVEGNLKKETLPEVTLHNWLDQEGK